MYSSFPRLYSLLEAFVCAYRNLYLPTYPTSSSTCIFERSTRTKSHPPPGDLLHQHFLVILSSWITQLLCLLDSQVFSIGLMISAIRPITRAWILHRSVSMAGTCALRFCKLLGRSQLTRSLDTSVQSSNGHHVLTPPLSYQSSGTDHTPSPIATSQLHNHPLPSPGSGGMSVASMVSPTTDQSMLRRLDNRQSSNSDMMNGENDSRRQSVNSQLGFGELKLASSPYQSNNQSTTSIQSTLQQQRHPGGVDRNSNSRFSQYSNGHPTTPAQQRNSAVLPEPISPNNTRHGKPQMIGPIITGPVVGKIARALDPVPGEAWAFPEEDIVRLPSVARPSAENLNRQGTSFLDSRRSSIADSITSSTYTADSRYPTGQRRLDDATTPDHQRNSRASSEYQSHHHHHTLQNRQVSDLQSDAGSVSGSQPYSRTPELRVSHKLAERKRRTEMKELFDNLRDLMPQERGSKASKWEILTKGKLAIFIYWMRC